MLRRDQLVRLFLQLFLGEAHTLAEHFALRLHAVVGLFQLVGERLIALIGRRDALLCGGQMVLQPDCPAKRTQREDQPRNGYTNQPAWRPWGNGCFDIFFAITHSTLLRAFSLRPAGPESGTSRLPVELGKSHFRATVAQVRLI